MIYIEKKLNEKSKDIYKKKDRIKQNEKKRYI